MMKYIRITKDNLAKEHICCAISSNTDCQVVTKKAWLSARFDDGLVFLRGDVRGKLFIEYLPAEKAWAPVMADGYTYIDCFWVAGQFKGNGYGGELLDACIRDSREKGRAGICVLSSTKKKPFLSDPDFLKYKGFKVTDALSPFFTLMALSFDTSATLPRFRDCARQPKKDTGFTLYYADQCPFTAKYVPLLISAAKENGIPLRAVHIRTVEEAQNAPTPYTSFALFNDGKFLTNEIPSVQKFLKMAGEV